MSSIDHELLKTSWKIFDKNGTGFITPEEVGLVLYSVGYTPTQKESEEFGRSVADQNGNVSWESFQRIFSVYKQDDDNYARNMLTEAFRVYDRDDNGLIPLNDLRSILTTLGEPLTYEQMDELFQLIPVNEQGRIRSQDFINMLFTKWKI